MLDIRIIQATVMCFNRIFGSRKLAGKEKGGAATSFNPCDDDYTYTGYEIDDTWWSEDDFPLILSIILSAISFLYCIIKFLVAQ